jgi:hypothetical protein
MSVAVSGIRFSTSSGDLSVNWTLPESTASITSFNVMLSNVATLVKTNNNYNTSITSAVIHSSSSPLALGEYNLSIYSMNEGMALGFSDMFRVTIAANGVLIADANGNPIIIQNEGGGGGGGEGGGGEGGGGEGGGGNQGAFLAINGVAKGFDICGNHLWVSVGSTSDHSTNCIQTSTDGITWTVRSCQLNNLTGVAFGQDPSGGNMFLAIGNGGFIAVDSYSVIVSRDGITWNEVFTSPGTFNAIAYGKANGFGIWNVVGLTDTGPILHTSLNGVTWTNAITATPDNTTAFANFTGLYGIASGTEYMSETSSWVAVGAGENGCMLKSSDGANWTFIDPDGNDVFQGGVGMSITYSDNSGSLWVASGNSSPYGSETAYLISTSTDGLSWTRRTTDLVKVMSVAYGQDVSGSPLYVAVGSSENGGAFATSPNGVIWTSKAFLHDFMAKSVAYGNSTWVFGGDNATYDTNMAYSTNPLVEGTVNYNTVEGGGGEGNPGVPSAPTDITVVPGATTALVSWAAPESNPPITGYTIFCNPDNKRVNTASANATSLNVTGLKNGTSYTFAVVATNSLGTSHTASCTPSTLPGVPKVTVVGGNAQVTLSWVSKPAVGVPTTEYIVSCDKEAVIIPTSITNPMTISGLTNGLSYIFSVKAVNVIGTSLAGLAKPVIPTTVPGVPTNFAALAGIKSFQVTWTPPTADGGLALTEYNISYTTTVNSVAKTTVAKAKPVSPYSLMVTKLVTGTVYTVSMQAKNKLGLSAATSTVQITVQ